MRTTASVPEGYKPVGLIPQDRGVVRVCLLAREEPDPVGGRFVVLRESLDERALLGCLVDARGGVLGWLAVVIQDVEGLGATHKGDLRGGLTNSTLEARWDRTVGAFDAAWPGEAVGIGWETDTVPSVLFDPQKWEVRGLMHEPSGGWFEVCRDDRLLLGRGLPPFSSTVHRYLHVPGLGSDSPLVAVTSGAPEGTLAFADLLTGVNRGMEPLNVGGGRVRVRRFRPLTLADVMKVVGGGAWPGVAHGTRLLMLDSGDVAERSALGGGQAAEATDPDRLFLGRHGRWGRLVETLHLKLRLWADAVAQVRALTSRTQRPLFNLSPESFEAKLGDPAAGLPRLWTASLRLIDPGCAVELPLEAERTRHMLAPEGIGKGIYTPRLGAHGANGRGSLRLRRVEIEDSGAVTFEATLQSSEELRGGSSDLLLMWLNLGGARTILHGRVESDETLAAGEVRVRGIAQRLPRAVTEALKHAEGVPLDGVSFEVLAQVSTPCDLYALGVLGVQMLLTGGDMTLPVALDEMHTLAGRASEIAGEGSVADRVAGLFEKEARWVEMLGPQRLMREAVDVSEAFDLVPPDLWWEVLAAVLRMFPGYRGVSACRDLGDAPALAPHRVFDQADADLQRLLVRTRSLIVIDWRQNREVHAVIRRMRLDTPGAARDVEGQAGVGAGRGGTRV